MWGRVSEPLGGPSTIVEIDEAKFGRWKYYRGHYVDGHWVLGGIERGTDKMFLVPVPQQDSATLIPIVQQYVRHGMTIHTNMWKAYDSLSRCGYQHGTVNHSHFMYPADMGSNTFIVFKYKYKYFVCLQIQIQIQILLMLSYFK